MSGKYITTTIRLAVLSGSKSKKTDYVKETIAVTGDHKMIWSKNNQTKATTLIRNEAALIC